LGCWSGNFPLFPGLFEMYHFFRYTGWTFFRWYPTGGWVSDFFCPPMLWLFGVRQVLVGASSARPLLPFFTWGRLVGAIFCFVCWGFRITPLPARLRFDCGLHMRPGFCLLVVVPELPFFPFFLLNRVRPRFPLVPLFWPRHYPACPPLSFPPLRPARMFPFFGKIFSSDKLPPLFSYSLLLAERWS